ncbi:MAG: ATP-binding cassette domain-containing protein [Theionarchaea archaeon]|nr:ATP-binding cassette domain-containing protein [Theionarchaea archaeon]MBU7001126.1 ATP-binding cassette domain-containing protein [Theionarchaea archaeon]MBU7019905.1 ATP-binding cassette domain-containing protein [Theionarchaea archaeon]MBU7035396.1 ATP-binding cassette domain-containing protein [Theionarchaea archaeon]MBU7041328.1 ATP-binding cassette domain-containing protein [Theionarchaea archaeon]
MDAIACEHVDRIFESKNRTVQALNDVTITVKKGELFGLLGPNGAGKTTLIKILTTLLLPTSGKAHVYGYDVTRDENKIRPIINMVSGGEYSGYGLLTVRENLWMFSQFYGIPGKEANQRIKTLMERLGIANMGDRKIRTLSTGERQRVSIIRAFMTEPQVVFLDEPTLGLDVETARLIRRFIQEWLEKDSERTVLLTTHYMMEADELCSRIAIINEGKIVALDTPSGLKNMVKKEISLNIEIFPEIKVDWLNNLDGVIGFNSKDAGGNLSLRVVVEHDAAVGEVLAGINQHGGKISYLNKEEPTLEDVFLKLTGRGLE